MKLWKRTLALLFVCSVAQGPAAGADSPKVTKSWAVAEFGEPLYDETMAHWPYVNPEAPKGGKLVLGTFGSFDTLNPIILKGDFPHSIGHTYSNLMVPSFDELASLYGEIAESIELPADKSWAAFNIRPEAVYHDGVAITAGDFVFAFETIQAHARPFLKSFYEDIERVEAVSDRRVKYHFKTRDNMKPVMIAAGVEPLPRHYWADHDITETTLEPPLTSGPYKITDVDPGRAITYTRVENHWAADLPVNRGMNNYDEIRYEYYRDPTVLFEAFKAGKVDFRFENRVQRWKTGYDFPEIESGEVIKRVVPDEYPRGVYGYIFNFRRAKFQDSRVREAINYLYDFEAIQRTLFFGEYRRIKSYFPNSDFGASGPPSDAELAVLAPFRDQVLPQALTDAFEPPVTDGSGRARKSFRAALGLFKQAGYEVRDGKLIDGATGAQLALEILIVSPSLERVTAPFVENLRRVGIEADIRLVEPSQREVLLDEFDFDMTVVALNFFPPPGPELRSYFGSAAADIGGSANMIGIKDPVVDDLIEQIVAAKDLELLKATSRALDRVMLWRRYMVPMYFQDQNWIAYWNKFGYPEIKARYVRPTDFLSTWWIDPDLAASLSQ